MYFQTTASTNFRKSQVLLSGQKHAATTEITRNNNCLPGPNLDGKSLPFFRDCRESMQPSAYRRKWTEVAPYTPLARTWMMSIARTFNNVFSKARSVPTCFCLCESVALHFTHNPLFFQAVLAVMRCLLVFLSIKLMLRTVRQVFCHSRRLMNNAWALASRGGSATDQCTCATARSVA